MLGVFFVLSVLFVLSLFGLLGVLFVLSVFLVLRVFGLLSVLAVLGARRRGRCREGSQQGEPGEDGRKTETKLARAAVQHPDFLHHRAPRLPASVTASRGPVPGARASVKWGEIHGRNRGSQA